MNLINEQSVTTSASTFTNEELSPAQSQFKSSLESAVEFVATTTETVGTAVASSSSSSSSSTSSSSSSSALSRSPSSLSSYSKFSALSLPTSPLFLPSSLSYSSSVRCSSSPTVESINRQIEKISNTTSRPSDAFQINLIGKMPTTTTTTTIAKPAIIACGKTVVPSASPSSNIMKAVAPLATTVNIDNVNDVSDCIKNKNGDKNIDTTNPASVPSTTTTTKSASALAERERKVGCEHYKRRAMFVTPCCSKFYKCRYCHDENETHHFDRKTLTELICIECNTRQAVQEQCEKCGVRFGKYTCLICNLFDDEDKNQYHCDGCGICRIGGRENFFHCKVCNMCLPIELKIEGHRCVENISRSNCPVCLGAIHTSRIPCHIPDCGHLLHKMCFDQLLASGHYVCPTCQTSLLDMTKMWEYLDAQALLMAVPKKYENQRVYVFCNDCHETCKTKFHFVGLKCIHCGGYNTTQDVKRRMSWANDGTTSA